MGLYHPTQLQGLGDDVRTVAQLRFSPLTTPSAPKPQTYTTSSSTLSSHVPMRLPADVNRAHVTGRATCLHHQPEGVSRIGLQESTGVPVGNKQASTRSLSYENFKSLI